MIVGDNKIRQINREFREKDQATDILSFPQFDSARELKRKLAAVTPGAPPLALGDVVISIDTAQRQARALGDKSAAPRIRTLLIHGVLHLMGYDHERSIAQARRMFAREHDLAALMAGSNRPTPQLRRDQARAATIANPPPLAARSHRSAAQQPAIPKTAGIAGTVRDLRWSPAAMPERPAKLAKKSSSKHELPA